MAKCNDWWKTSPIIGRVVTKDYTLRNPKTGEACRIRPSRTEKVVEVVKIEDHRFYVTNRDFVAAKKCEPLIISDIMVKRFIPVRRRK